MTSLFLFVQRRLPLYTMEIFNLVFFFIYEERLEIRLLFDRGCSIYIALNLYFYYTLKTCRRCSIHIIQL